MSLLGDEVDAVHLGGDDLRGSAAPGSLTAMPSASVSPPIAPLAALDDILHRRIELGLDPDDLDAGLIALAAVDDAADQPAAADRNDQRVEVGHGVEHFERDRAGAGDDRGIVERMDEVQPLLGLDLAAWALASSNRSPWRTTVAPWPSVWVTFIVGVRTGHDDRHRDAEAAAVVGDRLGVVAGRGSDDAAGALVVVQRQQFVERAALLVGGGVLQILELQPDVGAGDVGQSAAAQRRGVRRRRRRCARRRPGCRRWSEFGSVVMARGLALHGARRQCYAAAMRTP